jgi:hypothetical protein
VTAVYGGVSLSAYTIDDVQLILSYHDVFLRNTFEFIPSFVELVVEPSWIVRNVSRNSGDFG